MMALEEADYEEYDYDHRDIRENALIACINILEVHNYSFEKVWQFITSKEFYEELEDIEAQEGDAYEEFIEAHPEDDPYLYCRIMWDLIFNFKAVQNELFIRFLFTEVEEPLDMA